MIRAFTEGIGHDLPPDFRGDVVLGQAEQLGSSKEDLEIDQGGVIHGAGDGIGQ
jgi:hypothetical protein